MNLRKLIQERIRHEGEGTRVAGDVNAAVTVSVNEPGTTSTRVSSRQRIVQRSGRRHAAGETGDEERKS